MNHRFLLPFVLMLSMSLYLNADEAANQIRMHQVPTGGTHLELPMPADVPEVYYDSYTQEIIIDGGGVVNYYDVEIASANSWLTVISTQVNGSYDTIDISSLPTGEYCITIDSPWGNTYEGFFDTY